MDPSFFLKKRIDCGLSQAELGEALGYSAQTVSLWERGESAPSLSILGKYAALLGVDLEGLILGKDQKTNSYCEEKEFDAARFGSEVRRMRKNLDLTQEALAQKIGANARAVMRFERGESYPSVEQFLALCELFGKKPDELYFGLDLPVEAPPAPKKKPTALIIGIAIGALVLGVGFGVGLPQLIKKGDQSPTSIGPNIPSEGSITPGLPLESSAEPVDTSPIEDRYPNTQSKIEIVDGKIELGYYPQSHVADEETIAKLDALTRTNLRGFYELDGEYFVKRTAKMYYHLHEAMTYGFWFDDDTQIVDGADYWFKVEPISWTALPGNVIDTVLGRTQEVTLLSDFLLETGIPFSTDDNNYATSYLREWLNGEFIEKAFGTLPKCIVQTTVDNSVKEENNPYGCEDTKDYVFPPSVYGTSSWANPKATEYARCFSFWGTSVFEGPYYSRTPAYTLIPGVIDPPEFVRVIASPLGAIRTGLDGAGVAVRPMLTIHLPIAPPIKA